MTRYLLDTNVVSELRKPKPHGAVMAWLKTLRPAQILLSAVTIGELQAGVELTRKNDAAKAVEIEAWLMMVEASFAALPMDSACFREWARLLVGKSPQLLDVSLIAATARVHGLHGRHPKRTRFPAASGQSVQSISIRALTLPS